MAASVVLALLDDRLTPPPPSQPQHSVKTEVHAISSPPAHNTRKRVATVDQPGAGTAAKYSRKGTATRAPVRATRKGRTKP